MASIQLSEHDVSQIVMEIEDTTNIRPSGRAVGLKNQINDMVQNPYAAQITLQFALNSYKELTQARKQSSSNINPYLNNALENLALFRQ